MDRLTLREVARRAGVSHAAPYHHFENKASLVRTLATEAFTRLEAALRSAAAASDRPIDQLQTTGVAYVEFALENPVEFRFMFRRDLCTTPGREPRSDDLDLAGRRALGVLVDIVVACQAAGECQSGDPHVLIMTAWGTVHGLAEILLNAAADSLTGEDTAVGLAGAVIHTLMTGLLAGRARSEG